MSEPVAVPIEPKPFVADVRVKSASDEKTILGENLDMAGYRATHDSPFVADYFGLRDLYKTNPDIASQIDSVSEYLISQTEGESIIYAVKAILDQLAGELNMNDEDTGLYKLKKVKQLIKMKEKVKLLDMMKQQALDDIEEEVA